MVALNCEETLAWGSDFTLLRYSADPQLVHVVLFNEPKEELSSLLFCHVLISPWDEFGMVAQQRTFLFEATIFYPWGGRSSSDGALEQIQRLTQGEAHPVCLIGMLKEHSRYLPCRLHGALRSVVRTPGEEAHDMSLKCRHDASRLVLTKQTIAV